MTTLNKKKLDLLQRVSRSKELVVLESYPESKTIQALQKEGLVERATPSKEFPKDWLWTITSKGANFLKGLEPPTFTLLLFWYGYLEEDSVFLIPNLVANQYRKFLELAHNKMAGRDDYNEGLEFLNLAVCEPSLDQEPHENNFVLHQYKLPSNSEGGVQLGNPPPQVTHIYRSGII